jgi:hypothetical protein
MWHIFDSANLDQILAIVQNREIGVAVKLARGELNLIQWTEENNHVLS